MDEILIEEKKYVSSKQAAKMTGYAKDYVGQLCREGRVPARLVGRSWYVLESAIQDHRFGSENIEPKVMGKKEESAPFSLAHTWEFPRYEAAQVETLPSFNRLDGEDEAPEAPQSLNESWREWFDHVADTFGKAEEPIEEAIAAVIAPQKQEEDPARADTDEDVSVPVRVIHHQLPDRELWQRRVEIEEQYQEEEPQESPIRPQSVMVVRSVQLASLLVAVMTAALAVVGSGYFDASATSLSQASVLSGLSVYNK